MNKSALLLLAAAGVLLALSGCVRSPESAAGFRLPDGNADLGRSTFAALQCHECHTVAGETFPDLPNADPMVELGGTVTRVKTYGQLVTAIINPSHRIAARYAEEVVSDGGVSKMRVYNEYMTVQELIDLVAYLQSQYEVEIPQFEYRVYP